VRDPEIPWLTRTVLFHDPTRNEDLDAGHAASLPRNPNPALSMAEPGQTGLSENPLGTVDTGLSAASHKALRNREKP
jgi:hypothetical protein